MFALKHMVNEVENEVKGLRVNSDKIHQQHVNLLWNSHVSRKPG